MPIALVLVVLAEPLIRAWIRKPEILGAAPVIQILAFAVALRVGNATSTTLLKGSGQVRHVAMVNIWTGLVNLALSAALVKPFGLVGVAIGTLIPVAFSSIFVLFPAACRRVGVPVLEAFRQAVWPATWPALVVGALLFVSRDSPRPGSGSWSPRRRPPVCCISRLFVAAVGRRDREQYTAKIWELTGRKRDLAPAT